MATKKTLIEKLRNKLTYLSEEDAKNGLDELIKKNIVEIRNIAGDDFYFITEKAAPDLFVPSLRTKRDACYKKLIRSQ